MNEYRKLSTLKNWDKNPRSIKDKDFTRLKKQIQTLGQYKPLLITDDGTVLGGNMRLRAYKELSIDDIWVSVVDAPTEEKKLEYALSDNDRAGFYDSDLLANLIPEYPEFNWQDYAVDLKEPQSLQDLIDSLTPVEEDEIPEVEADSVNSQYSQIYELGRHRLMCGDATKIEDVEKLMNGQKADMVFTDPPYGMDLDTDYTAMNGTLRDGSYVERNKHARVIGDANDFNPLFIQNVFQLFGYCKEIFLWGADYYAELIPDRKQGSWVVWDKTGDADKDKGFGSSFELCWSKEKHKRTFARIWWQGIFGVKDDQKGRVHPTQKPVQLARWFLDRWCEGLNNVVDLFGGSGSTLIACEQTNRTCYMSELDEKYVDVIRKRYWKFTHGGKEDGWQEGTPAI